MYFYFNLLKLLNCFDGGIKTNMRKATWVHQIYAAGGASGPTTMVMVFVSVLPKF